MFHLSYVWAELRRRRGRALLTALGLGVGVALVIAVSAMSTGLDRAQSKVLEPLTGVGTDMSVTRPLKLSGDGFEGLSDEEREKLREENGGPRRLRLGDEGEPGDKFTRDDFASISQLSLPASTVGDVARIDGVAKVAGSLTLTLLHVEGTVPDRAELGGPEDERPAPGTEGGGGFRQAGPIDFDSRTVTGVDRSTPGLAAVTPAEITKGRWFQTGARREAVLNSAYAQRSKLTVGEKLEIKGKEYEVVGLAKAPLGGESSDIYVDLGELQALSDREGRVNSLRVRAEDADAVPAVERAITRDVDGSEVTTASDLAGRVKGSLSDARDLAGTLGTALVIVGLGAAVLLAALLTLSSVAKRTRELGTLKAIGWTRRRVVGQVTGESLAIGLLGGLVGAVIAIGALGVVNALEPSLEATVASAASSQGPVTVGGPGAGGPPGTWARGAV